MFLRGRLSIHVTRRDRYSGLTFIPAWFCLVISVTWMIGVYPYHAAFNSIDQAIEEQPAEPIPLLVIGLDGVDSETMNRLVANDSLPNLKKLIAGGFSTPGRMPARLPCTANLEYDLHRHASPSGMEYNVLRSAA